MFQRYKRCSWEIEDKPEDDEDGELALLWLLATESGIFVRYTTAKTIF